MKKKFSVIVIVIVIVLFAVALYFYYQFEPTDQPTFGITFSHPYAQSLGFDYKQVYLDMLTDLEPKKIRLVSYWDQIEQQRGKFVFDDMDFMLSEAQERGVEVILTLGHKVPRWPECHQPEWYKDLNANEKAEALDQMLKASVDHYKQFNAIKAWQVENEPYFVFGLDCPKQSKDSVLKKANLVKTLDSRPIILTASGEQGNWNEMAESGADIVGVTMYRTVYNDKLGYFKYPVGPWFYRIKAGILQKFKSKSVIGVELQAEPWLLSGIFNADLLTQRSLMNPKVLEENIEYAKKSGLIDHYLWGVEWWYWMAKRQNDWGMWAAVKDLLAESE